MPGQLIAGTGQAINLNGPDDFYLIVQPPNGAQISQAATSIVGAAGSASWGVPNVAVTVGSGADALGNFGPPTLAVADLVTDLYNCLNSGANNLRAVRVTDGTDIAAVFKINDNTGFASDTTTIAGTFSTSSVVNITLTPVTGSPLVVAYQVVAGDTTLNGSAISIANFINATSAVLGPNAFIQPIATPVAGAIVYKALVQGTGPNAIGVVSSVVGGTMTAVTTTATLTGGVAAGAIVSLAGRYTGSLANPAQVRVDAGSQSTTLSPTYKVTSFVAGSSGPEVFDNVVGYTTLGGGFVGATFQTNLANAINGTPQLSASRPASAYWLATAGSSTTAPVTGTVMPVFTSGTDGSAFAAAGSQTFAQLGNDLATPKTGMYALSGLIGGGQFFLCGNSDVTNASAAQIAFAVRENAHVFLAFPTGSSSATTIASKAASGIASPNATIFQDFHEFTDTINSVTGRRVAPLAINCAKMAIQSPETSPANQRLGGVLTGTERFSTLPGVLPKPYSNTELGLLAAAGINCNTPTGPGVNAFCIRSNHNSMGAADPRGQMAYSQMTKFIAASLLSVGGPFVGLAQSTAPGDIVRAKLRATLTNFVLGLINQGLLDPQSKDGILVDKRNNPNAQIAQGILRFDLTLVYLSIIDKVIGNFSGGQTNQIRIIPVGTTANS